MTSRHTRSNTQGDLISLTNQELASLERTNRQQKSITATMAASMQQMQQQMQQMQELQLTIAAQQLAPQREPPVPICERNLSRNISATCSAIAPPPC